MNRVGVGTVLLVWATLFGAATAQTRSPQQIFQGSSPSVVLLVTEDAQGRAVALGTGFLVQQGVLAANLHLFQGAVGGYFRHIGGDRKFAIAGIVAQDRAADLVLLSVPQTKSPPLALANRSAQIGETVYTIGNPRGFEGTLSQGIVSGIRQSEKQTLLQITAPLSPGSSGGPVLDTDGKVIGIVVGTHSGQNLNFAVPAAELRALLQKTGPVTPLAAASEASTTAAPARVGDVIGALFTWERYGTRERHFSFSLQNKLTTPVMRVYYIVAFYDRSGEPVHVESGRFDEVIPAGLAKRVSGAVDVYTSDLVDKAEIKVIGYEPLR